MRDKYLSKLPKGLIPYTLPKNWTWFYWSDIIKSYQQGMIRSNRELGEGNVYYLKMGDIDDKGGVDTTNLAKANATEKEIKEFSLAEGDFLINVRNSRELVGKTCVVRELDDKTILYNHMLVRIDNGCSEMNFFINAFLNIPTSKKLLGRIKQGTTTVIALYQRDLYHLPIALPDNPTFNTIVSLYKSIDSKIELNNKINRELEAMAKTLYDYWFVQFDFPNAEGKPYKSSGGKMVYNQELKREIPEGWAVKTISKWIKKDKSGDWGKEEAEGNYQLEVSCIRGADLNGLNGNGELKAPTRFILEKNSNKLLENQDLIVEISGGSPTQSTGRLAFITEETLERFTTPIICSNFCKALTLKDETYLFNFVYQWNRLYDNGVLFGWEGKTSGIKNLLFESFVTNHKEVYPPSILVQQFYDFVKPIHGKIQKNLMQNQHLTALRGWLLPMLMNGQVTVKEAEEKLSMAAEPSVDYKTKK